METALMKELREYGGATYHPVFKSCRASMARKGLVKAKEQGEVEKARVAVLTGSMLFGPDDPTVRKVKLLMLQVEHFDKVCRDCLTAECLNQLLAVMPQVARAVERIKKLQFDIGPKVWENVWLARAKDRCSVYSFHKQALKSIAQSQATGVEAMSAAWAALACSGSSAKRDFGTSISHGLTLSKELVGPALVRALAAIPNCAEDARTPEDARDRTLARITGVCNLLSVLPNPRLDFLLLTSGPDGRSALAAAAQLTDSTIFIALYRALTGEVITLDDKLEQHIYKQGLSAAKSDGNEDMSAVEWVSIKMGRALGVEPKEVCVWQLAPGGLGARLFGVSDQPSMEEAEQILGVGVVAEPLPRIERFAEELARWSPAEPMVREYFELHVELPHSKERFLAACAGLEEGISTREAAEAQRDAAAHVVEEREQALEAARQELASTKQEVKEQAEKAEMLGRSDDDEAEELYEEAMLELEGLQTVLVEKIAASDEARNQLGDATSELAAAEQVVALRAAGQATAEQLLAESTAVDARKRARYDALLQTPYAQPF